jgi:uncharacterized membrane protein YfcA
MLGDGIRMEYIAALLLPQHYMPLFVVFFAAFVQAITGFGLVILAAPLLMIFFEAKETILITLLIAICSNTMQTGLVYKDSNQRLVRYLVFGAVCGLPIGLLFYHGFSNAMLKIAISIAILAFLVISRFLQLRFQETTRNSLLTGALSGFFYTTTGMGGIPLILYTSHMDMTPRMMRGTSIFYFFFGNLFSFVAFYFSGTDFSYAVQQVIYLLPGLFLGLGLGHVIFPYVPVAMFRKMVFALLYLACFYSLYGAIM